MKSDVSVIILAKDEQLHISRCLSRIERLNPAQIFVVDCFSQDGTSSIAKGLGATVVEHEWPGLYAKQFNWALDNLDIMTKWVLRLDADEYLTEETIELIKEKTSSKNDGSKDDITAYSLLLKRTFWGQPVSKGVGGTWLTRLFRYKIGRCEDKCMDEHIIVSEGRIAKLNGGVFVDDNLNGIDWWTKKHLGYAEREAEDAINGTRERRKNVYYRLPKYWRAFAYFLYRYFIRGGFLEGSAGFKWHFFQGLWYRLLVDAKIDEKMRRPNVSK
jgi:glycosyltransferase involved in cell wall biosynthesis